MEFRKHHLNRRQALQVLATGLAMCALRNTYAQPSTETWRPASEDELKAILPARAPAGGEHIETEMRTASGITNGHGKFIAGVVLITEGYAANGKYSHYLVTQIPIEIGGMTLRAGEYVLGWKHEENSLSVHLYDATTGALRASAEATAMPGTVRVESFKLWPPQNKSSIQIGRFAVPYRIFK